MEEFQDRRLTSSFDGRLRGRLEFIAIDNFLEHNHDATVFFLSHVHMPQLVGIYGNEADRSNYAFRRLFDDERNRKVFYCSEITKQLLDNFYPRPPLGDNIKSIRVGERVTIHKEEDGSPVTVTLIESGHMIGAVMFLFECKDGYRVLYTGHFRKRLSQIEEMHNPDRTVKNIAHLYLDTTFLSPRYSTFASHDIAIERIIQRAADWLEAEPSCNVVAISSGMKFGYEDLLIALGEALRRIIVVPPYLHRYYYNDLPNLSQYVEASEQDCSTETWYSKVENGHGKIHYCYDQLLCMICDATEHCSLNLLKIRPCARSFSNPIEQLEIVQEEINPRIIKVNYSLHCSYNELCNFVEELRPEKVHPIDVFHDETTAEIENLNIEIKSI